MSNYRSNYRSAYRSSYRMGAYVTEGSDVSWDIIYDGQNIDLAGNSTLVDAGAVATWKNSGTMGAAADLTQATGAKQPLFRLLATNAKINNKSAVESDGTMFMATAAFATRAQPTVIACVFRPTDLIQAFAVIFDGITDHQSLFYASTGALSMYGGSVVATSQTVVAATWETCVASFTGATSFNRLNGAQSGALNVGTSGLSAVRLFTDIGTTNTMKGMIADWRLSTDPRATPALVESIYAAKYGATPQ